MPKTPDQTIASIDPDALAAVTGGNAANEQVMTVLRSVVSSIKELATSRGGSNDSFMPMMMMMMMMRGGQSAPAQVAAGPACQCQTGNGWIHKSTKPLHERHRAGQRRPDSALASDAPLP